MKMKKAILASVFVLALAIPTTLGLPASIAYFGMEAPLAEARRYYQHNIRIRNIRTNNSRLNPRFTNSSLRYTLTVASNRTHVTLTASRDCNSQQLRSRVGSSSWSSWRRANISRRVAVPASGQRAVRIQVRSSSGMVRTFRIDVRRASTNTFAASRRASVGTFDRSFNRNVTRYTLTLPEGNGRSTISMTTAHRSAEIRMRVNNGAWSRFHPFRGSSASLNLRQGETATVRFQIRGAFNREAPGPNHTRTYTIRVRRAPFSYRAIFDDFVARINEAAPRGNFRELELIYIAAQIRLITFFFYQPIAERQWSTVEYWDQRMFDVLMSHAP